MHSCLSCFSFVIRISLLSVHCDLNSETISQQMVCVVLAVVAARRWHLHQMDVKNTFHQGDLEKQVYMIQPPGFQSEMNKSIVCQLKKLLYGLK